jgi:ChrR-like protein with cupin domain
MRRNILVAVGAMAALPLALVSTVTGQSAAPAPVHVMVTDAEIVWKDSPGLNPGGKIAVVSGNPASAGPFTIRLHLPAGYKVAPHWHPTDEHVTVLSGTFAMGMGEVYDESQMKDLAAGGYTAMPAEMRHFGLAKTTTVVQVHGTGPFASNYVNPADDPRRRK